MYKGSSSSTGGSSKLLWKWEKNKDLQMHQTKLQEIKSNRSHALPLIPGDLSDSMNNSQALRQQHFLYAQYLKQVEIEKQNELYVRKLLSVQATQSLKHSHPVTPAITKLSQTNNKSISFSKSNNLNKNNFSSTSNSSSGISMKNKNSNAVTSQRMLAYPSYQVLNEQRATQAFFRRIEQTKSVFNNSKWSKEAAEHAKALKVCSKFTPDDVAIAAASRQHRSSQELRDNDKTLRGTVSSVYGKEKFKHKSLSQTTQLNASEISANNDKNTMINVALFGNIQLPSDSFIAQQSDNQKKQFLKQILAGKKQVLYRKTAEIEGEKYFAEIKIENGNFQIELENASGMIFTKSLPQTEGMEFFARDCNSDFAQLFRKILINKASRNIQFRQVKPIMEMNNLKDSHHYGKSTRSTKYPTSRQSAAIFNEDDQMDNQDARTSSVKSKQRNIIAENKRQTVSAVLFPKVVVSHREELKDKNNKSRGPNDLQNVSNSVKLTKSQQLQQSQGKQPQKLLDSTQKPAAPIRQSKEQSQPRQVKDKNIAEDKIIKHTQVNSKQSKGLNNQQHNAVSSISPPLKNNNTPQIIQKQADKDKLNKDPSEDYEAEYEDPFEKFDEEDRQQKEKLKVQNDQDHTAAAGAGAGVMSHHPHETTDKKMNSFSFQQTNQFKKNAEKEEEQKGEEEAEEIENYEFEEDSSGTQYEINDQDKQRIEKENKNKNKKQGGEEEGENKQQEDLREEEEEQEEEYADEFE